MKFLLALTLVLFSCGASNRSAVFSLIENNRAICTGFNEKIGKDTFFISAGHCSDSAQLSVMDENDKEYPVELMRHELNWDIQKDYALYKYTKEIPAQYFLPADPPPVGSQVSTVEGPLGLEPFPVTGTYIGKAKCAKRSCGCDGMFLLNMPAGPGASGSPILDSQGRVWAILVGINDQLPGVILGAPLPENK